jgi:hypothetical protein
MSTSPYALDAPQLKVCSIDLHALRVYVDRYRRVSVKLPLPTQMFGDERLKLDTLD